MEFVGNRINFKTVSSTIAVAFLAGRINLFDGTFPAAIALITVMLAVSTVYIYLVPVIAISMALCPDAGMTLYGDISTMIFCGVFFLVLHRQKFTINQRTAVAIAALISFHGLYYAMEESLYLLSTYALIKEAIAITVYIRVFNTVAKVLFIGKDNPTQEGEKITFACILFSISLIGAVGIPQITFPLWLLLAGGVQYCCGIGASLQVAAASAIYWHWGFGETGGADSEAFVWIFAGLAISWFAASLVDSRYRKTILAMILFGAVALSSPDQVYGAAAAMALLVALPSGVLARIKSLGVDKLLRSAAPESDIKMTAIKRDLHQKKQVFEGLSKLYGTGLSQRQIISYQFQGMARTVDSLLDDLNGRGGAARTKPMPPIAVGGASYAFEDVSGDSCNAFSFGRGGAKQALIISDGMGKGSKASAESNLVVETLSRLMKAGFDVDVALKTVNATLMPESPEGSEMFATVDLAIIDKETGKTQVFKMGAASTFVRRGDKVAILKRPAPPVGLIDGMKLEYIDVRLKAGDLLVMVSDGITDCDRNDPDCRWLQQRLLQIGSRDPDTISELLINKAAEKYGIKERDDLTVMVAAI